MDDIYFRHTNKRPKDDDDGYRAQREPHYDPTAYDDNFEPEPSQVTQNNNSDNHEKKFTVHIPDEEISYPSDQSAARTVQSRTPKGAPVSGNGTSRRAAYYDPSQLNTGNVQRNNRTPQGARKQPVNSRDNAAFGNTGTGQYGGNRSVDPYSGKAKPTAGNSRPTASKGVPGKNAKGGKKKSSPGKKAAIAVLCVVLALICGIAVYGYILIGKINYDTDIIKDNQYISESALASSGKVKNILFIGSDARSEIAGMRSDTMILFSIDKQNKNIKLTSFLRDSYVCIPSTGRYRKLNAACSSGGAQLVIDTIEYNFKVKIDNYVLVDFEAFKQFIDLLGGLTVHDVTEKEAKYLRDVVKITYAKKGTNKFSGAAALWYCRIRYLDDDFHRTERQRKVITAIMDQASKTNPIKLAGIVEEILPLITTDMSRNSLVSLAAGALGYMRYETLQHQIPADGTWSNARVSGEGAVLKMDIDENASLLKEFLYSKAKKD